MATAHPTSPPYLTAITVSAAAQPAASVAAAARAAAAVAAIRAGAGRLLLHERVAHVHDSARRSGRRVPGAGRAVRGARRATHGRASHQPGRGRGRGRCRAQAPLTAVRYGSKVAMTTSSSAWPSPAYAISVSAPRAIAAREHNTAAFRHSARRASTARVREVRHREELDEVVLHRRARQQHAFPAGQRS